jgi:hypothetical protein
MLQFLGGNSQGPDEKLSFWRGLFKEDEALVSADLN